MSTLRPAILDRTGILFPVVALAWAYVGLRIAHSAIHVTYNRVRHRLVAFAAGNVVLVMLWTSLLRALSS